MGSRFRGFTGLAKLGGSGSNGKPVTTWTLNKNGPSGSLLDALEMYETQPGTRSCRGL